MDYSKMTDFEINSAVARAAGLDGMMFFSVDSSFCHGPIWDVPSGMTEDGIKISRGNPFAPCNNAADAWPIIADRKICLAFDVFAEPQDGGAWVASPAYGYEVERVRHDNPLRAAMLVYLQLHEAK